MKPIVKSSKLANVCYDIRGPVLDKARQMEEEGQRIIKLNIGNIAAFGLEPPDEIVQDMIRNLPNTAGYTDSKGLFAPRKAVVHETQQKGIRGVSVEDVYLGNGASELIVMALNALLDDGDEVLLPAPDYPLYTAAVALSGGTPVHYVCDEGSGWMPDIADIRSKVTDRTKAIVIINPNNPTGALYPREVLEQILQKGIDSGEFRALDVRGAVMSLIFPMIMLCLHKHSLGACAPATEMMDPHGFIRQHVEVVLHGLRADTPAGTRGRA